MNLVESFAILTNQVDNLFESGVKAVVKRAPELLAGMGIASFIGSTVAAVAATPEALDIIADKKYELGIYPDEKLPVKETVKATWKLYLPAILTSAGGICFVAASVSESNYRYLTLSTSYQLLQDVAYSYRDKVVETLGAKKEEKMRQEIAQKNLDEDKSLNDNTIIITNQGNTLFKDTLTGQYFRYDISKFKNKAIEYANYELNEGYVGVPEWLLEFGLTVPDTMMGMGWSVADQGKALTIDFTANVATNYNDEPCLVINYYPMPISDFDIFYK